jgi:mono/diheme cytochrome c family protein
LFFNSLWILCPLIPWMLFGDNIESTNAPADWKVPAKAGTKKNPFAGNSQHAKAGQNLFERYCSACHGKKGEGIGKAVSLHTNRIKKTREGELFWFLHNGNSREGMPAWSRLPDQQIWQLVTFLQIIQKE